MFLDTWNPGWRACYAAFFTHVASRSGSTRTPTNYESILRRFFEAVKKEPQFVTKTEVETWLGSPLVLRERGKAPAGRTRNSRLVDPWRPLHGNAVWLRMRVYLQQAGMDESAYSPHSIRRAAALARYQAGSGVLEIMSALNHKNLAVSLKYLTGLAVEADTGALLLLEKYGAI